MIAMIKWIARLSCAQALILALIGWIATAGALIGVLMARSIS